jgi:hypothetical protein
MTATRLIKNLIRPLVPLSVLDRIRFYRNKGITVRYKPDSIEICRGESILRIGRSHEVYLTDMVTSFDYYFGAVQAVGGVVDFSSPPIIG